MNKALITVDNQSKTSSVVDYKEFSCPPNDNSNSTEDYMFKSGLQGRNCGGGGLEESQLKGKI